MARRLREEDRIEPAFGLGAGGADLRLSADDRPTLELRQPRPLKRRPAPAEIQEDDAPEPPRRRVSKRSPDPEPARRAKGRKRRGLLGTLIIWGLTAAIWALILAAGVVFYYAAHLPPTHTLEVPPRPPNVKILAAGGQEIADRGDMGGQAVRIGTLPPHVPNALIAIEDRRFHSHFGLDVIGLARAAYTNVTQGGVQQGGSTLTQQLAKNLFLTPDRTMGRKIQEAVLALWLERNYSKDAILELYLNRVYFGAGAYGVEAAARRYYAKPASQLTIGEAAVIAGLVKAPSRLAPTRNPAAAEARAQVVITAMVEQGFITESQAKAALSDPPSAEAARPGGSLNYVADWIMDLIDDHVGKVDTDLIVTTTIDATIQSAAEKALTESLARAGARFDVRQGAVVVMEPNGAVKALVGGRAYGQSQFNRAVSARRQPGSAFKTFVFLAAIEKGLTPATLRLDAPVTVAGWRPENYTRDFRGETTLSAAFAGSLNTVAVRLGQEVGPKNVVRTAQRLGVGARLEANPSIALGTSEVSLLELTGAYAPFANGGLGVVPHAIHQIKTASGRVLFSRTPTGPGRVVQPAHVGMMNAMMHETVATGTGRAATVPGWTTAGKTGTSQDFRDAWFIGHTARYVGGVWLGNDDGKPTRRLTGGALPAEIWARVMREAHAGQRPVDLPGDWRQWQGAGQGGGRGRPGAEPVEQPMSLQPLAGPRMQSRNHAALPADPERQADVIRPR